MRLLILGLLSVSVLHTQDQEVRWCRTTKLDVSDQLQYPPIAKAAHVSGTVIARVQHQLTGAVSYIEIVSGPPLLGRLLTSQLEHWRFVSSGDGNDPCQTLLIAEFTLGDGSPSVTASPPDIIRVAVHAVPAVINSLPSTSGAKGL